MGLANAGLRRVGEDQLTAAMIALASQYGRYGYRRITAMLNQLGLKVGKDRVQRIWRRMGLKSTTTTEATGPPVAQRGFVYSLRPERSNHVWSWNFVAAVTHDGRRLKILTLLDEHTRECLALWVWNSS